MFSSLQMWSTSCWPVNLFWKQNLPQRLLLFQNVRDKRSTCCVANWNTREHRCWVGITGAATDKPVWCNYCVTQMLAVRNDISQRWLFSVTVLLLLQINVSADLAAHSSHASRWPRSAQQRLINYRLYCHIARACASIPGTQCIQMWQFVCCGNAKHFTHNIRIFRHKMRSYTMWKLAQTTAQTYVDFVSVFGAV